MSSPKIMATPEPSFDSASSPEVARPSAKKRAWLWLVLVAIVIGGGLYYRSVRAAGDAQKAAEDRKSTRLNSSHANISYAVFCLKKKKKENTEEINNEQTTS